VELADALWNSPAEVRPTNARLSGSEWYDPDSVSFNEPPGGALVAPEHRWPLLDERGQALPMVVRRPGDPLEVRLVVE
jgi:hypothetical protein